MPRAASMPSRGSARALPVGAASAQSLNSVSALSRARVVDGAPSRGPLGEIQRARLLAGAVAAIDELGYAGATVGKVTGRARVSRRTFYELFANLDECLAAVLGDALARVERELDAAGVAELGWRERVRAGLAVILGFLDREPALARVGAVQALRAGGPVQEARERVLARLVGVVDEGRLVGARGEACSALTAEGLVGAALAIVHTRIAHPEHQPLGEQAGHCEHGSRGERFGRPRLTGLLGELMGMIVLPYLGPAVARRERERKPASAQAVKEAQPSVAAVNVLSPGVQDPLQGVSMRLTYRTARVLEGVRELSGDGERPSNRQIGTFAGVGDPGQISKLLRRLERLGLIENHGGGHALGEPNQWRLTVKGDLVVDGLRMHATGRREAA
jgi:AcrR family transcriptional regulator